MSSQPKKSNPFAFFHFVALGVVAQAVASLFALGITGYLTMQPDVLPDFFAFLFIWGVVCLSLLSIGLGLWAFFIFLISLLSKRS